MDKTVTEGVGDYFYAYFVVYTLRETNGRKSS